MTHDYPPADAGNHVTAAVQSDAPPPLPLTRYGWSEARAQEFAGLTGTALMPGRVIRAERDAVIVATAMGVRRAARHPGTRPEDPIPCTGDWIAIDASPDGGALFVRHLLRRHTALVRSSAGRASQGQVLAANVDTVAIVVSAAATLNHNRTERMLALAWESGAAPVVVLTKADLASDADGAESAVRRVALGADTVLTSAVTGRGLDRLTNVLTGTIVLLGPSGAGKSTLGNALIGDAILATGHIREVDGRGRHTTAWRELIPLPGGNVLIDTPGLRTIGLRDTDDGIHRTFADIENLASRCRFSDCAHDSEPGCAVQDAIDSGTLPARRLDSYRKLLRENEYEASRTDARARAERSAFWKGVARQQRAARHFHSQQEGTVT